MLTSNEQLAKWMMSKKAKEVRESRTHLVEIDRERVSRTYCGCALGKALVGKYGDAKMAAVQVQKAWDRLEIHEFAADLAADLLGISPDLAHKINRLHFDEIFSADQIAEQLLAGVL
jgi:hypothetical protein